MRIRKRLMRMTVKMLGDDDLAQDILQDAFCSLWSNYKDVDNAGDAERIAFKVVKNKSISRWRHESKSVSIENEGIAELAESDTTDSRELANIIWSIVEDKLSPLQRDIMVRYEQQGQSAEEIAAELGKSIDAVRMNLSRARKTIREIYLKEYEQ